MTNKVKYALAAVFVPATTVGLYVMGRVNFLFFHWFIEAFSIIISFTIFVIAYNTRRLNQNRYLLLIGLTFPFVGLLDFLHMLSYKGMGVFRPEDPNFTTTFWIQARLIQAAALLAALYFAPRKVRETLVFAVGGIVTAALLLSVYPYRIFPLCYLEPAGLTPFKIGAEYFICALLVAALWLATRRKGLIGERLFSLLIGSIFLMIASELAFTLYVGPAGFFNVVGHLFKVFAFFLIYKCLIEAGLKDPVSILFGELKQSEEILRFASGKLTASNEELVAKNKSLQEANQEILRGRGELLRVNTDLENIFRNMGVGTVLLDRDLRVTRANKAAGTVFDLTEARTGHTLESLKPHFSIPRLVEDVREVISTGTAKERKIGGDERQFNMKIFPYIEKENLVSGTILTFHDITDTVRSERVLREQNQELTMTRGRLERSERHFQDLFHQAPVGYVVTDEQGLVKEVNSTFEAVIGFRKGDLIGRDFTEFIHTSDREVFARRIEGAVLRKARSTLPCAVLAAGGRPVACVAELYPERAPDEAIGTIRIAFLDVTEMTSLRAEREKAETLYEMVFSASKDSFIIMSADDLRYIKVNDSFTRLTGFSAEELIGRTGQELGLVVDYKHRDEILREMVREGSVAGEASIRNRDGKIRDCQVQVQMIRRGGLNLVFLLMKDITERKRLERSLEEVNSLLKMRNDDLENFIQAAANDLRSPLIDTIGNLVQLRKNVKAKRDPDAEGLIDRISVQLQKYDQLLRNLLDYAKVSDDPAETEDVEIGPLVLSILDGHSRTGSASDLNCAVQEGLPAVRLNRSRVHQVFEHLISNASRFRREGVPLKIEIGLFEPASSDHAPPGHGIFFVRDNGIGIPPRDHQRIFSLLTRPAKGQASRGTGMGLAIVKRILAHRDGWITVESVPGEGATFIFTMPLASARSPKNTPG